MEAIPRVDLLVYLTLPPHLNYMSIALPETIKIDDIASGKIDPDTIYAELDRLKVEVNILRNDMSLLIKALGTIPENQNQQEYYNTLAQRVQTVKAAIKDYCVQYNRLLPILNLALIKLGQDVEILNGKGAPSPQKGHRKRNSMSRQQT